MVIGLTERAAGRLREIIAQKGEDLCLRIIVRPGGCSGFQYGMALERTVRPDDVVSEHDGLRIVVDPASLALIEGATIDYLDTLMGGGFTVANPNAVAGCSCGQSFRPAGRSGDPRACQASGCAH